MFADPAQPSTLSPSFIHHRLNINTDLARSLWVLLLDPCKQVGKFRAKHIMIVIAPRITRNLTGIELVFMFCRSVIVKSHHNYGSNFGEELTRVGAQIGVTSHPLHLAVVPQ